MLKSSARQEL